MPLLCVAVKSGRVIIAERLLVAGANTDLTCKSGETALYLSAVLGRFEMVSLLLKHNADPNLACTTSQSVLIGFSRTLTPLHIATINKHEPIVRQLLLAGANPTLQCSLKKMPCEYETLATGLGLFLSHYTKRCIFDEVTSKILTEGSATTHELHQFCSLITSVYDLRVVFSIGGALCSSGALSQEEFGWIMSKALEQTIDDKLFESHRAISFFCLMMRQCFHKRLIRYADYIKWKASASQASLENHEQMSKVKSEIQAMGWQLSIARLTSLHNLDLSKQKDKLEFISVALAFVNSPVFFYTIYDDFVDLASPVELLGATVDSGSIDSFLVSDSSEVTLNFLTMAVLQKANIKPSDFMNMLRGAVKSESNCRWLLDQNYLTFTQQTGSEASLKLQTPAKLSQLLLEMKTIRAQEPSKNEPTENVTSDFASALKAPVDQNVPAPWSSTLESVALEFLDDIDRYLYHLAIQLSNGRLHEFTDIVREIEKDVDENFANNSINEIADVQYSDGSCGQLSPLEYACHMGYTDIVKYLLDRDDVVKSMKRGSYLISAKRRQNLLQEAAKASERSL